jgi:N-acyl-D-aspartate/D-glutamate deacylase
MVPKVSRGVTLIIARKCGIGDAPVKLHDELSDPMSLLGSADAFRYPSFAAQTAVIRAAAPLVNVAAPAGHTALRNNQIDQLERAAPGSRLNLCGRSCSRRSMIALWG